MSDFQNVPAGKGGATGAVPSGIEGMLQRMMGTPTNHLRVYGGLGGDLEKGVVFDQKSPLVRTVSDLLGHHQGRKFVASPVEILGVFMDAVTGVTTGTSLDGFFELPLFCLDAAENSLLLEWATITMGFGGSTSPTPLRFPSYIVPAMRILSGLEKLGLPLPTVRLVSAQMAAVKINGMSEDRLWPVTLGNFAIARMFARRFFPKVAHRLVFDFDQPLEGAFLGAAEALRTCAMRDGKRVRALDAAFEAMARQGQHHGGVNGALLYAGIHTLYSPDFTVGAFGSPWISECHRNGIRDRAVITLGGEPERFFNALRDFFSMNAKKIFGGGTRFPCHSLRLLIGVGHIPVYYPKPGEIGFECPQAFAQLRRDCLGWRRTRGDRELAADFDALEDATGGWENLLTWAEEIAELLQLIPSHEGARELFMGRVLTSDWDPLDILDEMNGFPPASFISRCAEMRSAFLKGVQLPSTLHV